MDNPFRKKKLIKDISANMLQTVVTQFFGLLIFYFTSRYLPKDDFGEYNWSMAVGFTVISVASLGLDLVLVKRIASGLHALETGGIHFFHTITSGLCMLLIAVLMQLFIPAFSSSHPLFLFVFINILVINITNTFKLCLNGLDSYRNMAVLALSTNIFKFGLIVYLYFAARFTVANVIAVMLASSALEFILGYYLVNKSMKGRLKPLLKVAEYRQFIIESLPQLGVVIFDSALSRMDIILLGVLSTAAITAEYSFVYKVYELSKLPLLIIGPVLLTRFSRLFGQNNVIGEKQKEEIHFFFRLELFIIMLIPIGLISVWSPLVDYFTSDKYGSVNETKYWLLSVCVPLVCVVNFLWTLGFVQGQLKAVMFITIAASALNIIANLVLIPFFGGLGSAAAFLLSTIVQVVLYLKFIDQSRIKLYISDCVVSIINAAVAVLLAKLVTNNAIFTTITSLLTYTAMAFITRQISLRQIRQVLHFS